MARFKNRDMARIYDGCRRLAADRTSEFWYEGRPRRGAAHRAAYWNGRGGQPNRYIRGSACHAAWAAGQDDLREHGPVEGWQYRHR